MLRRSRRTRLLSGRALLLEGLREADEASRVPLVAVIHRHHPRCRQTLRPGAPAKPGALFLLPCPAAPGALRTGRGAAPPAAPSHQSAASCRAVAASPAAAGSRRPLPRGRGPSSSPPPKSDLAISDILPIASGSESIALSLSSRPSNRAPSLPRHFIASPSICARRLPSPVESTRFSIVRRDASSPD